MTPMFSGELAFLSNFDTADFQSNWFGGVIRSVEHGFNAAKSMNHGEQKWVLDAETPGIAKSRGRQVTLRPGWDAGFRVAAMQTLLHEKFTRLDLRQKLLDTGSTVLIETNHWHDNFWGSCYCEKCGSTGVNMLGELLMSLRVTARTWP